MCWKCDQHRRLYADSRSGIAVFFKSSASWVACYWTVMWNHKNNLSKHVRNYDFYSTADVWSLSLRLVEVNAEFFLTVVSFGSCRSAVKFAPLCAKRFDECWWITWNSNLDAWNTFMIPTWCASLYTVILEVFGSSSWSIMDFDKSSLIDFSSLSVTERCDIASVAWFSIPAKWMPSKASTNKCRRWRASCSDASARRRIHMSAFWSVRKVKSCSFRYSRSVGHIGTRNCGSFLIRDIFIAAWQLETMKSVPNCLSCVAYLFLVVATGLIVACAEL